VGSALSPTLADQQHPLSCAQILERDFAIWRNKILNNPKVPEAFRDESLRSPVDWLLGLDRLQRLHAHVHSRTDSVPLARRVLEYLNVTVEIDRLFLDRIPERGPLVVTANHPFGVLEGFALLDVIKRVRPDVRLMATTMLLGLENRDEHLLYVDNVGGTDAEATNRRGLLSALRWLKKDQGVLIVFPAGAVSRWNKHEQKPVDLPWSTHVAGLIQASGANVLPAFVEGRNSRLFYTLGKIKDELHLFQLIREFVNKRNQKLRIRLGPVVPAPLMKSMDPAALTEALRESTSCLENCVNPFAAKSSEVVEDLAASEDRDLLASEIDRVRSGAGSNTNLLYGSLVNDGLQVVLMTGNQSEVVMREITRLREQVFRAAGEGSGKAYDRDVYDDWYWHLILWDPAQKKIAGAYRAFGSDMGSVEKLYLNRFFKFSEGKLNSKDPFLELGRAFVLPEYHGALDTLWKGIGSHLNRNPRYRKLMGSVSMSKELSPYSHHLIVEFLKKNRLISPHLMIGETRPAFQLQTPPFARPLLAAALSETSDAKDLSLFFSQIERSAQPHRSQTFPQLIKHYGDLLGGRVVGFF
jgi:putative hemolysin